ncbi:MAG: amino acid ABC transporter permease [Treponema sp.]|jgi:polar amino acid transport system permease protein|nr:amino acid ABC transporter permease [Treponema sp.]
MFSLYEGAAYDNIPLYRRRWFVLSLFFAELWIPLLLYYLLFNFFDGFWANRYIQAAILCVCWGLLLAVLFSGDIYALRKDRVYRIRLKYLFVFLYFLLLAAACVLVSAAVFAVLPLAPEKVRGFFGTVAVWAVQLMEGSRVTVWLTILAVSAGLVLSLFLALGKMSKKLWLNRICSAYVFFFRGTPLLMQLYFIYYGLPQITPALTINNRFIAAFIAFSLNSAAYCAEIIRAAIQSIDRGQFEAAKALRMSYGQTMALVIIPQSIRRLIPPVGNEFIMMLKDASLVSIIALTDITKVTRSISSSTGSAMVYIPAMVLYLIITAVFTFIFHKLEKKYSVYV